MTASPHILVVEDDAEISRLVTRYLRANDCRVSAIGDARGVDRLLEDSRIDLIVLDLMLPGEARAQVLDELTHMSAMVESVLSFLRDGQSREQASMVDLATSLQTICDQFADTGRDVRYAGPDHVVIRAKAAELHRAITNLIDNAARYGHRVDERLMQASPNVIIAVEDDGPGIADRDKNAMLEPFVRGDAARGMNHKGGFGLGLSIARAVIEAHDGTLALLDRVPSGLIASVTLPQCARDDKDRRDP